LLPENGITNLIYHTPTNALLCCNINYEGWNFNSGNYLFTTDTK